MPVTLVERLAAIEAESAAAADKHQQQPSWQQHQQGEGGPVARALAAAFQDSDEALCRAVDCQFSGAAVVACLLQGRHLTTAWLGDCRAVLARADTRGGMTSIPLTRDHKPANLEERARIVAAGGRIEPLTDSRGQPLGPMRVWLGDSWVPGLAMSRALGDVVAHSAGSMQDVRDYPPTHITTTTHSPTHHCHSGTGVSSNPDTFHIEITPQDRFLILATDGGWQLVLCSMTVSKLPSASVHLHCLHSSVSRRLGVHRLQACGGDHRGVGDGRGGVPACECVSMAAAMLLLPVLALHPPPLQSALHCTIASLHAMGMRPGA